ncbi:M14 family zinc carboxypeptidase [Isoptericola chiayiensis]|uniref:M14 family zinc carboxypeptidase n=1 Tax=Isoptericola chiayiensis TaxID=579446 RepID=A0ABP8XZ50_9MICO|nr:hypothetical protein [Isoptericola chiayiensis]
MAPIDTTKDRPAVPAAGPGRDLHDVLDHVRGFAPLDGFPGVDEIVDRADRIAAAYPGVVARRRIGTSRLGEPLHEYVVGDGPDVLVIGGVHPNEPIGFHTALQLLDDLAAGVGPAAAAGARWHVVPCIDPDGARLNESWFADPGDRVDYARGFYRPAPDEQVEWSFPLDHGTAYFDRSIPEAVAVARLVDRLRPAMVVGLHNGELGGVYYYLDRDVDGVVPALQELPARLGLPLDRGEPETPESVPHAPGVFRTLSSAGTHDWLVEQGIDPSGHVSGGGLADYVAPYGSVTFVAELPYWSHADSDDVSDAGVPYADVLRRKADGLTELGAVLTEALDRARPHLRIDSPLRRASEVFVPHMALAGRAERERAATVGPGRSATVAEVFSNGDLVRCFRLRYGSMLHRALTAEVVAGIAAPQVRAARDELGRHLEAWYAEARSVTGLTTWPVERLVAVQYASTVLVAAATVRERGRA